MPEITREAPPTAEEFGTLILDWQKVADELARVRASEMLLRLRIFKLAFPEPKEGTNKMNLGKGYGLTASVPYAREVDEEAIKAKDNELKAANINPEALIKHKPELILKTYRTLTAEQLAVFDTCLTIKPGSPSLKLTTPKDTDE